MYEVLSNCSTAQAQYAGVKSAVLSSQTALAQVNSIEATDNETREVETIVQNIKAMFEKFESKLRKFESSLGNVKAVNRWREVLERRREMVAGRATASRIRPPGGVNLDSNVRLALKPP